MAIISAGIWLTADATAGHSYTHPLIAVWNTLIHLIFFLIITFLLAEIKTLMQRAEQLSRVDNLTGAINSRFFYSLADSELDRLGRYERPLTVAYLDLDNFKTVNDTRGHLEGDKVLRTGGQLRQRAPAKDRRDGPARGRRVRLSLPGDRRASRPHHCGEGEGPAVGGDAAGGVADHVQHRRLDLPCRARF